MANIYFFYTYPPKKQQKFLRKYKYLNSSLKIWGFSNLFAHLSIILEKIRNRFYSLVKMIESIIFIRAMNSI